MIVPLPAEPPRIEDTAKIMALTGKGCEDIYVALNGRLPISECWQIVMKWGGRPI